MELNKQRWVAKLTDAQQKVVKRKGSFTTTLLAWPDSGLFFCEGCRKWHVMNVTVEFRCRKGAVHIVVCAQQDDREWRDLRTYTAGEIHPEKVEETVTALLAVGNTEYARFVAATGQDPMNRYAGLEDPRIAAHHEASTFAAPPARA